LACLDAPPPTGVRKIQLVQFLSALTKIVKINYFFRLIRGLIFLSITKKFFDRLGHSSCPSHNTAMTRTPTQAMAYFVLVPTTAFAALHGRYLYESAGLEIHSKKII
jgi:hypothetical protein